MSYRSLKFSLTQTFYLVKKLKSKETTTKKIRKTEKLKPELPRNDNAFHTIFHSFGYYPIYILYECCQ